MPAAIEPRISRESSVSVRWTWSASETPALCTVSVNVLVAPPAVTVAESKCFVTLSCDVLVRGRRRRRAVVAGLGSFVPVEATVALFSRTVPLSTVEASVTCTRERLGRALGEPGAVRAGDVLAGGGAAVGAATKLSPPAACR